MLKRSIIFIIWILFSLHNSISFSQEKSMESLAKEFNLLLETAKEENFNEVDSLLINFNNVLDNSIQLKNKKIEAESKYWIGRLNFVNENRDSAHYYFSNSFELSKEISDTNLIINNYYGIASCLTFKSQYLESSQLLFEAIDLASETGDSLNLITLNQAIAYQFQCLGNPNKNIEYLNNALDIATSTRDTNFIIYLNIMLYEEGIDENRNKHITSLEQIVREFNQDNTNVTFYDTYAKYLLGKGDQENALKFAEKALEIVNKSESKRMLQITLKTLGDIAVERKNYKKAEEYYLESLEKAEDFKYDLEQIDLSKRIAKLYSKQKDFKKAYHYSNIYINRKDSINHVNKLKEVANATEKFQSEKKNQKLAQQQLKIKEQENEVLKHQKSKFYLIIFSITLLLLIILILLFSKYRQALKNKEIEKLNIKNEVIQLNALIEGEEKERKRIAQDLHDGISGDLSAIKYKIDAFTKYELTPNKHLQLQDSLNMIDQTIDQVRSISHDLAPPILRDMKLNKALWQYCNRISNENLEVDYQYFGAEDVLNSNKETAIYRIIQELVNNTQKHAQASYCLVEIHVYDDSIHIMVEDDGIGIKDINNKSGLGMSNIKSRVLYLNAKLDIDTSEEGTTVTVDIQL